MCVRGVGESADGNGIKRDIKDYIVQVDETKAYNYEVKEDSQLYSLGLTVQRKRKKIGTIKYLLFDKDVTRNFYLIFPTILQD